MSRTDDTHTEALRLLATAHEYITCEWLPRKRRDTVERLGRDQHDSPVDDAAFSAALDVYEALTDALDRLRRAS